MRHKEKVMKRRSVLQGIAALFVLPYVTVKAAVEKKLSGKWIRMTWGDGPTKFYTSETLPDHQPKEGDWEEVTHVTEFGDLTFDPKADGGYIFSIKPK